MRLVIIALLSVAATAAAAPLNLLRNGGFETSTNVVAESQRLLRERGVALPAGDPLTLPAHTHLNPADGWLGASNRFEYVTGTAGQAVHAGTRAVRIVSPTVSSALALGESVLVVEGIGLDERAVPVGQPLKFSFWAKGQGAVRVNCYLYGHKHENLYEYVKLRAVAPEGFAVADAARWRQFAGTLTIREATVSYYIFVIAAHGDVTLDDVVLEPAQ